MKKYLVTLCTVALFVSASPALAVTAIPVIQATAVQVEGSTTTTNGIVGQPYILDGTKSQDDASRTVVPVAPIVAPPSGTTQAGPALLEIDTIKGESPEKKKGNVEYGWKVEKGESAAPANPTTPDFSILLSGGESEQAQTVRTQIAEILLKGAQEEGSAIEHVSLNFEKIIVKYEQEVKLFGFIPMSTLATVEIDTKGEARARFPWWAFLASGADKEQLRQETLSTLSSVLQKNQALVDGLLIIRY